MSSVSDPLYNDLNKTNDFWEISLPPSNLIATVTLLLWIVFFKNTYNILRKDRIYDIKVRPHD